MPFLSRNQQRQSTEGNLTLFVLKHIPVIPEDFLLRGQAKSSVILENKAS